MSGKKKNAELLNKKSQFYVEFLGWMECNGLRGQRYTDPVIKELRRRQLKMKQPPRLTLQVSKKELKVSQDFEEKGKRKIRTVKFPSIPARDIAYSVQPLRADGRPDDIVACIYLGFVPRTNRYVHVHVYRFDSSQTANTFCRIMNFIVDENSSRLQGVERDLMEKGEIEPLTYNRLNSSDGMSDFLTNGSVADSTADSMFDSNASFGSDHTPPSFGDDIDPDLQSLHEAVPFDSVTEELKQRLRLKDTRETPLLLPPKDYDTVCRKHGNLSETQKRRLDNVAFTANMGMEGRDRNGSGESGVDLPSPSADSDFGRLSLHDNDTSYSPPVRETDYTYSSIDRNVTAVRSPQLSPRREVFHGRQPSRTSQHSTNSYRSGSSNNSNEETYQFRAPTSPRIMRHEPEEEIVLLRRTTSVQRDVYADSNLNHSMPADILSRDLNNSRRDPYWRDPTKRSSDFEYDIYTPRSEGMVRRTNSLYR